MNGPSHDRQKLFHDAGGALPPRSFCLASVSIRIESCEASSPGERTAGEPGSLCCARTEFRNSVLEDGPDRGPIVPRNRLLERRNPLRSVCIGGS